MFLKSFSFFDDIKIFQTNSAPVVFVKSRFIGKYHSCLQSDIMRRSFDNAVAAGSKNTEAWIKLANEAFAPLTSRMSETVDKMNKLAA